MVSPRLFCHSLDKKGSINCLSCCICNRGPDFLKGYFYYTKLYNILTSAAELKYTQEIKRILSKELTTPSDDFIRFVLKDIYSGMKTQNVIDKFRDTTRRAFNQFINDTLNERL
jgi:hypothetical protein